MMPIMQPVPTTYGASPADPPVVNSSMRGTTGPEDGLFEAWGFEVHLGWVLVPSVSTAFIPLMAAW